MGAVRRGPSGRRPSGAPLAGPAASVEAWPATAAVRPLGGSAWPLGWRNPGGLCSTGHGRLSGVQLIHVDADGFPALDKPGPDGLPKRSFGQMAGAVCVLGLQGHGGVNVAEGLADALALAARLPWRAVCMGGTAGFHNLELARRLMVRSLPAAVMGRSAGRGNDVQPCN